MCSSVYSPLSQVHVVRAQAPLPQLWPSVLQQVQSIRVGDIAIEDSEAGAGVSGVLWSVETVDDGINSRE